MFWQHWPKYEHPSLNFGYFISFFASILHSKHIFDYKLFLKIKTTAEQHNFSWIVYTQNICVKFQQISFTAEKTN